MSAEFVRYRVPLTAMHTAGELGPGWTWLWLREGTDDDAIIREVTIDDTYRLRGLDLGPKSHVLGDLNDPDPQSVVIDLGANLGAFSATCLQMRASRVIAIEPEPTNAALLRKNLAPWIPSRAEVCEVAVGAVRGRVDVAGGTGTAHIVPGDQVACVTLADILEPLDRVALCKVDVEGAEHGIITACPHDQLAKVDRLVMELHGPPAAPWADPSRWGQIVQHLLETHACDIFGRPSEGGGHLFAHRYPRP